MSLASLQRGFLAEIAADDTAEPSSTGMAIYRNAYRARLLDALASGYERTRTWVGEDAFAAAATHYILAYPPQSWTLDAFGEDFPATLAALFADDPEVAELAWLEWHMQQAFAAPDRPELTAAALAAAGLDEADWAGLRLTMAAGYAARSVSCDLAALWHGLAAGALPGKLEAHQLIVWRSGYQPHFRLLAEDEFAVLTQLASGQALGSVAGLVDEAQFGQWLAAWLGEGLFSGFALAA